MLLSSISDDLSLLWPSGVTLNLEEKMNLQLSLLKIHEHEDFEEVLFWGKIRGIMKDYYIAISINYKSHHEFPHKRFFWCTGHSWEFAELLSLSPEDQEFIENFNTNFSGEHDRILVEAVEEDPKEDDQDSIIPEDQEKIPTKNFTELDRLSYVVRAICHDCQLVPYGSFRITPGNELTRNKSFSGLLLSQVKDIKNYGHFRPVELEEKRDMIDRGDGLNAFDFFDPIEKDTPKGSWSLVTDPSGSLACLRSQLWPGYFAYHLAGSQRYGGVYIGDGIKNSDLAFML
jgi:radial spoke head protein 9